MQLTVIVSSDKEKTKHFTVAASQTTSYKWMAGKNGHHQLKVNKYISQHGFRTNTLVPNVYDQRNGKLKSVMTGWRTHKNWYL